MIAAASGCCSAAGAGAAATRNPIKFAIPAYKVRTFHTARELHEDERYEVDVHMPHNFSNPLVAAYHHDCAQRMAMAFCAL